jgi:hypothetical protein
MFAVMPSNDKGKISQEVGSVVSKIAMAMQVTTRRSGVASDGLENHVSPEED